MLRCPTQPLKTKLQIFGAKANSGTRCAGPAGVRSHLEATQFFFIIDFLKERNDRKSYISTVLNVYYKIYLYMICILYIDVNLEYVMI